MSLKLTTLEKVCIVAALVFVGVTVAAIIAFLRGAAV